MTWEEKLSALQAIGDCAVRMRKPGNWYVDHHGVGVDKGAVISGRYGKGATPQEAVEDHWRVLTTLEPHECLQTRRGDIRWNGYMWDRAKSK